MSEIPLQKAQFLSNLLLIPVKAASVYNSCLYMHLSGYISTLYYWISFQKDFPTTYQVFKECTVQL